MIGNLIGITISFRFPYTTSFQITALSNKGRKKRLTIVYSKKVHEKYLSDLEFSELKKILDGEKGIKFIIKGKTDKDKNTSDKN